MAFAGKFDGHFETWMQSILPEDRDKFVQTLHAAIKHRNTTKLTIESVTTDGSIRWLLAKAIVRTEEQEIPIGVLGVSMDISTLKQAQEALLQSEKLAAAGRLAASISHEINNPLESVTNLLFLIASDGQLSAATREFVEQAEEELARVSHIATQTLRFYRQSSKPTIADVSALLDSVLSLHRGRFANMQVDVDTSIQHQRSLALLRRRTAPGLHQPRQQRPRCHVRQTRPPRSANFNHARLEYATARYSHHRCGQRLRHPPGHAGPYLRAVLLHQGNRGTGLGLWVTKEIIDKHQGIITYAAASGNGTVFSIFFPFNGVAEDQNSDSAIPLSSPAPVSAINSLYIPDQTFQLAVLRALPLP